MGLTLRRRRWWVCVAVIELLFAVVLGLSFDDRFGIASRLVWGPVYAVVPALVVAALVLGLGFLLNVKMFGRRLREGVVLEAGFGDCSVVLRGPWATTTLSFAGIASVRPRGHWVFLQQVGSPVVAAWPAALFDPEGLARLQHSLRHRAPSPPDRSNGAN